MRLGEKKGGNGGIKTYNIEIIFKVYYFQSFPYRESIWFRLSYCETRNKQTLIRKS